jgi:Uri superfamily endonuclease
LSGFRRALRVIGADERKAAVILYSAVKAKEEENHALVFAALLAVADFGISDFDVQERTFTEKDLPEDMPAELRNQFVNKKTSGYFYAPSGFRDRRSCISNGRRVERHSAFFALSGPLV